jgi:hypothetical protein
VQSYVTKNPLENICRLRNFFSKFNKCRAFNKAVGHRKKNPKLINIGPTFILDYRVPQIRKDRCNAASNNTDRNILEVSKTFL